MLVREGRILLDSMLKDYFCVKKFESISLSVTSLGFSII